MRIQFISADGNAQDRFLQSFVAIRPFLTTILRNVSKKLWKQAIVVSFVIFSKKIFENSKESVTFDVGNRELPMKDIKIKLGNL